ncbi:hypothetical protein ACF0H5_017350 [Mactra antiquata]
MMQRKLHFWESGQSGWSSYSEGYTGRGFQNTSFQRQGSKSSSFEDSSKSSCSLSLSSFSSSDREKNNNLTQTGNHGYWDGTSNTFAARDLSTPLSQVSANSSLPSWYDSDLPLTSASGSRSESTGESMFDDGIFNIGGHYRNGHSNGNFRDYVYKDCAGPTRQRSNSNENLVNPYSSPKKTKNDSMSNTKEKYRQRDLIAQDEEEDYPFSKYKYNKKSDKSKKNDIKSGSSSTSLSNRSSSQESIYSVNLMKQFAALKNAKMHRPINKQSSSSSMMSSQNSSHADFTSVSLSMEDSMTGLDSDIFCQEGKGNLSKLSSLKSRPNLFLKIPMPGERAGPPVTNQCNYQMYNFPQVPNTEQMLNDMGFNEACSILPERFLKSWLEKALLSQQEEYVQNMMSVSRSSSMNQAPYYHSYCIDDNDLPPSVSAHQSGASTPQYMPTMDNFHGKTNPFGDGLVRKGHKKLLQRSASLYHSSQSATSFKSDFEDESELAKVGALPLKKENSFDKLKRMLQTSVPNHIKGKSYRRSMFASNHQNSLPIFLETLSEEEDESKKQSRAPSMDKNLNMIGQHSKMRSFLEEEERLSCKISSSECSSASSCKVECLSNNCTCGSCMTNESDNDNSVFVSHDGNDNDNQRNSGCITIPSIIISEKDAVIENSEKTEHDNDSLHRNKKSHNSSGSLSEASYMSRPLSPNPDNQALKNCSEITDIFNKNNETHTTDANRLTSKDDRNVNELVDWPNAKNDQVLRLHVTDLDDKYLSPSSSIASPNIMSPVTVIEVDVGRLDNQNDSIDKELLDGKQSRRNSVEVVRRYSTGACLRQRSDSGNMESASYNGDKTKQGRKSHLAPKCLTLKRHFNGENNCIEETDSSAANNVSADQKIDKQVNELSIQTDDTSLAPLIQMSEVTALLERLYSRFPCIVETSPYFIAQDKSIQCDLSDKKEETTVDESPKENYHNSIARCIGVQVLDIDNVMTNESFVNASCQTSPANDNYHKNYLSAFEIHPSVFAAENDAAEHVGGCLRNKTSMNNNVKSEDFLKLRHHHNIDGKCLATKDYVESKLVKEKASASINYLPKYLNKDNGNGVKNELEVQHLPPGDPEPQKVYDKFESEMEYMKSTKVSVKNICSESAETADESGSASVTGTVLHRQCSSVDSSTCLMKNFSVVESDKVSLTDLTEEDLEVEHVNDDVDVRQRSDSNDNDTLQVKKNSSVDNVTKGCEVKEVNVAISLKGGAMIPNGTYNVSSCFVYPSYRSELKMNVKENNQSYNNELKAQDVNSHYSDVKSDDNSCNENEDISTTRFHSECNIEMIFNATELVETHNEADSDDTMNDRLEEVNERNPDEIVPNNLRFGMNRAMFKDSGIVSEDCTPMKQNNKFFAKFQELIDVFDKKDNSDIDSVNANPNETESSEMRSQVMSTRSLDFETIGSRKGILQRCVQTEFAKSFDYWGYEIKNADIGGQEDIVDASDNDNDWNDPFNELEHNALGEDNDEVFVNVDDSGLSGSKVSYQVALKYNKAEDNYDLYGRVKFPIDECVIEEHDKLNANDIQGLFKSVSGNLKHKSNRQSDKVPQIKVDEDLSDDSKVEEGTERQAFNMFEQIDHRDNDNEEFLQRYGGLSSCSDLDVTDNDLDETLAEIERLYTASFHEEHTILSDISEVNSPTENVDLKLEYFESYQNKFGATETHVCRNCGHSVSVPVSGSIEATIKHDYCCECSPLNLTADMLEKRRMERMLKSHDNQSAQPDEEVEAARREIARESDKIRREMERERRAKSMSPLRDRSPTRTYLTLTQSPKTLYDKGDRPQQTSSSSMIRSTIHPPVHSNIHSNVHTAIHTTTVHQSGSGSRGKSLSDEEKERTAELKATQNALDVTQGALNDARKDLKQVQAQYEDIRTQLMLSEYKRETTSKELARLSSDVQRKQVEAKNLDSQTKSRREELEQFDAIGFTKDEAVQIIEENEKMKGRLRSLDAIHAERDELIQQLESAKQELFTEQKRARTRIEELKEELETATCSYEQTLTEKDEMNKKLQKLDTAYKKMEKDKNELIQEKTRQYEEERNKLKAEKNEWRKRSYDEADTLRQDLIRMTNRVAGLQDEVKAKEDLNLQLRNQILNLEDKVEQEKISRTAILEEHKKTLQALRKDTDSALMQMRESLFLEKQKTIDAMRTDLEQERRDIASRSEERYVAKLAEQEAIIKTKTEDIITLRKYVDKLETDMTKNKVKMDDDLKVQVQEAVSKERMSLEREKDWAVQQEKDKMERDHKNKIKHFQDEIYRMQQEQKCLRASMKDQGGELEDLKNANKTAMHEKLVAVARAKEMMKQEHVVELDRIKEQLKNEHKKEVDRLRETIRLQEIELRTLKEDQLRYMRQQKEVDVSQDRTERTLINEINDECRKTSDILGLSPRKVSLNNSSNNGTGKSATNAALFKILTSPRVGPPEDKNTKNTHNTQTNGKIAGANLRACNEELRNHVTDLQHEIEVQRNTLNIADREKDEALATLKRQLEKEKEEEMARLKERLVRGLSTNEYRSMMYTPDNDVTVNHQTYEPKVYPNERHLRQVSEQQQEDLQRLEREINRLAMTGGVGVQDDVDYSKRLSQLQSKVKQLQMDNTNLRRAKLNVSSSSPDLTSSDMYPSHRKFTRPMSPSRAMSPTRDQQRMASALELRVREQDYETAALSNHQRRNRDIMSKKMAEMSKLQNTLTNQAKELIQLEKAYTQLNQHAKSGRHTIR